MGSSPPPTSAPHPHLGPGPAASASPSSRHVHALLRRRVGVFHELIGATMLSFYDWCRRPAPGVPQVFGDQTDVPEAGDWYNAQYLIMWAQPAAHPHARRPFHDRGPLPRAEGRGGLPDYAENTSSPTSCARGAGHRRGAGHGHGPRHHATEFTWDGASLLPGLHAPPHRRPLPRRLEPAPDGTGYVPGRFVTADEVDGVADGAPKNEFAPWCGTVEAARPTGGTWPTAPPRGARQVEPAHGGRRSGHVHAGPARLGAWAGASMLGPTAKGPRAARAGADGAGPVPRRRRRGDPPAPLRRTGSATPTSSIGAAWCAGRARGAPG